MRFLSNKESITALYNFSALYNFLKNKNRVPQSWYITSLSTTTRSGGLRDELIIQRKSYFG